MREYNLLDDYPSPQKKRLIGEDIRTINHRIVASYKGKDFFDGDRNYGYGGFKYDGRWKKVADKICIDYELNDNSSFLQLGCEKGFLLHDLKNKFDKMNLIGLETSQYAVSNSLNSIKKNIKMCKDYLSLDFEDNKFDFTIALGIVYTHNLGDAMKCIKEIERVGKGKSFITLASFDEQTDYWQFKKWSLLGTTILKKSEWREVLNHCNYSGDYYFTNAETLNLIENN